MDLSRYIAIKSAHRKQSEKAAEEKRRNFFEAHPEMKELSDEIAHAQMELGLQTIREADTKKTKERIQSLTGKWKRKLLRLGFCEEDFEPRHHCNICEDSGYAGNEVCSCLKKIMAEDLREEYELSHMLKVQNFQSFDLNIFSDEPSIEIKQSFVSQRDLMQLNLKKAQNFVSSFPCGESLLFIGGTGLGKTFLANCIADAIISKGCPVVYHRYVGLEMLLNEQMSYARSEESAEKFEMLKKTDLLIIDDLCPARYENLAASLFEIIDIRQSNALSTVITTNLSSSEIAGHFGDRFHSRLQRYTTFTFIGKDARGKL